MWVVDISTDPTFAVGNPTLLFEGSYVGGPGSGRDYDVTPDGQRFLMVRVKGGEQAAPTQMDVVLNWFEELKRLVPTDQ